MSSKEKKDPYSPEDAKFSEGESLEIESSALAQYGEHFDSEAGCYVQHNEHGDAVEQLVEIRGEPVKVISSPYVSQHGPNKGEVVYPVTLSEEAGGAMVGVPERRLRRRPGKKMISVAMTQEEFDRIFGASDGPA